MRDLKRSADRIPDAVTIIVCGAPGGFEGVGFSEPECLRNAERLSVVRGAVQLVPSCIVPARLDK